MKIALSIMDAEGNNFSTRSSSPLEVIKFIDKYDSEGASLGVCITSDSSEEVTEILTQLRTDL